MSLTYTYIRLSMYVVVNIYINIFHLNILCKSTYYMKTLHLFHAVGSPFLLY
jgi:hypothetical protein